MPKAVVAAIIDAAQLMAIAAGRSITVLGGHDQRRHDRKVHVCTTSKQRHERQRPRRGPNRVQPPCPVGVGDRVERPAEDEDERRRSQHGDDHEPTPHLREGEGDLGLRFPGC